jgi:hypothetical protein
MAFKLNAYNTSCNERDNAHWLWKAGFVMEEIIGELKECFKKSFRYRFKKIVSPSAISEEEQP